MRCWLPLGCAGLLLACAGPGLGDAGPIAGQTVPRGATVLLLPVEDDQPNSGAVATADLRQLLSGHGFSVVVDEQGVLEQGFLRAPELGCELLMHAQITEWQDSQSMDDVDRVALRVRLWRAADRALLAWGHQQLAGDATLDSRQPAHRLLQRIARRILQAFFEGPPLPWDSSEFDA